MIQAKNIHKSFGTLEVLKGIDLSIEPHEVVSIVGPSGAGKTTLLQIMGTLSRPTSGRDRDRRHCGRPPLRSRTLPVQKQKDRLCLPVPPPAARIHRFRKRLHPGIHRPKGAQGG